MAPVPKNNSIDHFTHPGHPLLPADGGEAEFLCDGCKTLGTGKKYRCNACDFDLHDYCATCPRQLTSFMHKSHALTLVMRKASGARQVDRICNVCSESVEGLFYRCKVCEFDVHPLCTQLPEHLKHALHEIHPLTLQSSPKAGACAVCRGSCSGWRYRCGICMFDIHLECILVPVVKCQENGKTSNQRGIPTKDRGIPFQAPPQFAHYSYGFPPGYNQYPFGPGYNNMHYYNQGYYPFANPSNFAPPVQSQVATGAGSYGAGRMAKSMFSLVGQLGFGVVSNMIFGVDVTSVFAG